MDDLTSTNKMKTITWPILALMALCTVIGLDDIMYNFQNQGMPVITSWIIMCLLYVTPYSLMVGQLGSTFDKEGGGLSSWVRGTDGEFLGYFTAWTYWAASIPYAVDSANEIIVDLGWAVTGTKDFQDKIPTSLFAILTFVVFIIFIIVEHHFSNSMEFLSTIGGGLMIIMVILFVILAFFGLVKSGGHMATKNFGFHSIVPDFNLHYWSTVGMLIYAMNGCELVAPYVTKMKKPKTDFPKAMIALAVMTAFLTILGSFALGIYFDANHIPNDLKMNGAYYLFDMLGEQFGMGHFLLYFWAWTSLFFNCALVAVLLDAMTRMLISDTGDKYMPKFLRKKDKNGLPVNGYILTVALSSFIMILGIFLPDMNDIFNWLLNLNSIISPGVTCWIFYSFMRVRKNSKKYPSKYVYIKNDKVAWLVGIALLIVTAVATILGFAPQDIKQGTGLWWYELIINIVTVVVLIGLGAILPGIRRREVEYGVAFDKAQWIWMGILIIGSIILDIWLGSTKIPLRIAMIVIQAVIALILTWLVGRRKPANATK
ncbi:APC family permease [Lactobacillus helveticus]|uniref:Inner membrane transporter YcaM n=4 Tax=Lactobacillus helveticus TaxID=1587 RepID=A0A3Q8SPK0_LACHE|nr:amino acid permease [Lactobacillus helveticus]AFR22385.1 amino acid transporter [Lactobacillus helveticus R0052]AZK91052.1 Inner membrane transporter YcaM [Lactobacillus helveticus]MBW8008967.1 APC family permease [Lactobacillus helveticus]MBW8019105.1 APC family permease [Lactobacillus helveticus]MBW8043640.1 APC family permease [Lactobacillus helveticus]